MENEPMLPGTEDIEEAYRACLIRGEYEDAKRYLDLARLHGVPEKVIQKIQDEVAGFSDNTPE